MTITKDDRPASVVLILIALSFFLKNKLIIKPKDLIWMVAWAAVFMYINIHGMLMLDLQQVIQSYGYLFKMLFLLTVIYAIKKDFHKTQAFFLYGCPAPVGGALRQGPCGETQTKEPLWGGPRTKTSPKAGFGRSWIFLLSQLFYLHSFYYFY